MGSIKSGDANADEKSDSVPKGWKAVLIPNIADMHRRDEYTLEGAFDQYGVFTIKGIAPGAYKLYAWEKIEEDAWSNPDLLNLMQAYATDVTVNANEKKQLQVPLISAKFTEEAMAKAGMQ